MSEATQTLTAKDFKSDQEVRWCPGCGDYSILANFQRTLPSLGIPREKHVVVGGIGCSSRFPYYMNTYGIHSIHGRAPAIATGLKSMRPDLTVWVITGDGDAMSIGGNHMLHVLRRNVDLKILLFNNRVYGLTKGQYSPTSHAGSITKSTPVGSIDYPVDPVRFALTAGATFVARTLDIDAPHFQHVLKRAAEHRGAAIIEIYQNCPIYNDDAFVTLSDKKQRPDHGLYLEHGKPLTFAGGTKSVRLNASFRWEVVDGVPDDALIYDETNPVLADLVSKLEPPGFPAPMGVFFASEKPTYNALLDAQVNTAAEAVKGGPKASLQSLLESGETWTVKP
ncbi:MAG: 2-oxoacid:ferredoxin oxidoreductase subunit beta [Polyangiales bacterium]